MDVPLTSPVLRRDWKRPSPSSGGAVPGGKNRRCRRTRTVPKRPLPRSRKRLIKVALVKDYLDAGKDVPSEVLVAINGPASDAPASSLDGAVRNISIGLGLFLALSLLADWSLATVALIPLFIGIGKLIVWRMNKDSADI